METLRKQKLRMIHEKDAVFFERAFNEAMEELAQYEPKASEVAFSDGWWWCVITYIEKEQVITSVKDEFHLEGIRYTCRQCPLHEVETDGRIKRVACKYSETGRAHLDCECCEYFYKMLKQNKVKPYEEV